VLDILEANRRLAQETRDGIFASHRLTAIAPEIPAARANGTVRPSDMPTTTSRTVSLAVKCFSACSGCRCTVKPQPQDARCTETDVVIDAILPSDRCGWQGSSAFRNRLVGSRAQACLPPQRLHDLEHDEQNCAGANRHGEIVNVQRPEAEESLSERP
jgi:hypothetical protein